MAVLRLVDKLLENLIQVQRTDYDANFSHIKHTLKCDEPPAATLRFHYVRTDASGEPRFQDLARLLARYITHYCFSAERRKDLKESERNELWMQARDLFRLTEKSGQAGELLLYFLLETVLEAPQILRKMPLTTNPREERKGSDGVHLRWDQQAAVLEVIFAESKIYKSFSSALTDAFKSMEAFHDSRTKQLEINLFTPALSSLEPTLQKKIVSYVEGDNVSHSRLAQACLIGFDWAEYKCLKDTRRAKFIAEFEHRYSEWASTIRESLNGKLRDFKHKHLRFDFFMLPFADVVEFRKWFNEALTGKV